MKAYKNMSKDELLALKEELTKAFEDAKGKGLKLDMSRGKPTPKQLDLSMEMLDILPSDCDYKTEAGTDTRNYGVLDGIPEAKNLMGEIMGIPADNVIVCGNASLPIMYDCVSRSMVFGVCGKTPFMKQEKLKFLCPAPGYDRHFRITETFGFEMIRIPMVEGGPDMDMVEEYVNNDPTVKGIWCVPKYSNPLGTTYSDETVRRFAALNPAADDFRIYWDNAYAVHHLYEEKDKQDQLLNLYEELKKNGKEDLLLEFASTSKVTFAGAGIGAVGASDANIAWIKKTMTVQTIGYDKMNMLRHVRYLKDLAGVEKHMMRHAELMRPKFEAVLDVFDRELSGLEIGTYTRPRGGYFISFDTLPGCAKAVVEKCKEAGVTLTGAGATFPYGKDPKDTNIRIAPSFPTPEEMAAAADLFVLCVKLVTVEKLLAE